MLTWVWIPVRQSVVSVQGRERYAGLLWRARIIQTSNRLCSLQDIPCPIRSHQQDEYEAHASTLPKDGRRHTWDQAICDCCSRLSLHVSQTGGAEVAKGPCRYWFWIICITIFGTTDT